MQSFTSTVPMDMVNISTEIRPMLSTIAQIGANNTADHGGHINSTMAKAIYQCEIYEQQTSEVKSSLNLTSLCLTLVTRMLMYTTEEKHRHIPYLLENFAVILTVCSMNNRVISTVDEYEWCLDTYNHPVALCNSVGTKTKELFECVKTLVESNITIFNYAENCETNPAVASLDICVQHNRAKALLFNATMYAPWEYQRTFYGFAQPAIAVVVLVSNSLLMATFLKGGYYSVSHVWLFGIALADILTTGILAPVSVYHFALKNYIDPQPYYICLVTICIWQYIIPICHGISIWLTTCFAVHRYFVIAHPRYTNKHFSYRRYAICATLVISCMVCLIFVSGFRLMDDYPAFPVYVREGNSTDIETVITTTKFPLLSSSGALESLMFLRTIFLQAIPCIIVAGFATMMIRCIWKARSKHGEEDGTENGYQIRDLKRLNIVSVYILLVFLFTEVPVTVCGIMATILIGHDVLASWEMNLFVFVCNVLVVVAYPLNFTIFCSQSNSFRYHLRQIFNCSKCRKNLDSTSVFETHAE